MIKRIYGECVNRLGADKVQVLSPFRKKGEASVNALNDMLWNLVNPEKEGTRKIQAGGRTFRQGDRIMHIKNRNGISNGDIGFVRDIYTDEDDVELAKLEFSDGRIVEYNSDELDMVEHGTCPYAQGRMTMPAESREIPSLKKGNSDAFFKENSLTKNTRCITRSLPVSGMSTTRYLRKRMLTASFWNKKRISAMQS